MCFGVLGIVIVVVFSLGYGGQQCRHKQKRRQLLLDMPDFNKVRVYNTEVKREQIKHMKVLPALANQRSKAKLYKVEETELAYLLLRTSMDVS